ncbi:Imm5 family immunity protein [Corallococcus interemptor]|nr:Imm5 family immunity protein [Corallococcus interemptor]
MGVPEVLDSLLQRAFESVRADPVHDLALGMRRELWRSLGPGLGFGPGYARRVALALATARHVLPLWELTYPENRTTHTVLDSAEAMRVGSLDKGEARAIWQQAWDHMVELSFSDEGSRGVAAGLSAVQALRTCIDDEAFVLLGVDERLRDDQVDAEDMDASMFAAAAYAGGPAWDASSDSARRLQFWEWWLSEAVPLAYQLVVRVGS